jgi:peptide/nickel transport system permease protein
MVKRRKKKSKLADVWKQLKKNKIAVIALFVIVVVILIALLAPFLAPYLFDKQDPLHPFAATSKEHWLGTDRLGRDVLSRLIYGANQSLQVGTISTGIAAAAGIIIGAVAGYYGGWKDNLIMRLLDIYQSIPMFLLCVTLAAVLGPSLRNAVIAIGVGSVPGFARLMRASILSVREMEYIEAAKSINAKNGRIILKHIIPNAISPLIVSITMGIGSSALAGAGLSFIGLGVQPPIPEWGAMISDARNFMREHGTLTLYPGICVMITVLAFNLLGDGLRDALDPRLKN